MTLAGQRALVTGAGRGNGAAIALGLAAAGAHVWVTDSDSEAARITAASIRAAGHSADSAALDVTDPAACNEVAARTGALSILVNNAGILLRGPLDAPNGLERFRATFDVNVMGMAAMALACRPALKATAASSTWPRSSPSSRPRMRRPTPPPRAPWPSSRRHSLPNGPPMASA